MNFGHCVQVETIKACALCGLHMMAEENASLSNSRSEGVPRTRLTKRSCACDCGKGNVFVGAFFLSFFPSFLLSFFSHQESSLKITFFVGEIDVLGEGGRVRGPGGERWKNKILKKKKEKSRK